MPDEQIEAALTNAVRAEGYPDGIIIGWVAVAEVLEGTTGDLNLLTFYTSNAAPWRLDGMLRNAALPDETDIEDDD